MIKKKMVFFGVLAVLSCATLGLAPASHAQNADTQPPTTPSSLSAVSAPPSGVALTWGSSSDNVGVVGYYVYRNGAPIVSVSGTSFTDPALAPGYYSYTVAAYDAAGNISPRSSSANIMVTQDTTPPSAPTGLSASPSSTYINYASTSSIQIALSWNASTDNVGVVGYNVYRSGVKLTNASNTVTNTSFTDTLPATPWVYSYTVSAYDAAGNISAYSAPATVSVISDQTAPSTPTGLSAKQTALTGVTLTWASSTDGIGIGGYYIERSGLIVGTSTVASYVDSNVVAGTYYSYIVSAYDPAGNISESSTPAALTVTGDSVPPSVPSGISARVGSSTIALSWYPSNDVVGVSGYDVSRNGSQIATNIASTSYLDTAPLVGGNTYAVDADNIGGIISGSSTPVTVSWYPAPTGTVSLPAPIAAPAPVPSSSPVSLPPISSPGPQAQMTTPASLPAAEPLITVSLSYGMRSDQVSALQSVLAAHSYLASTAATGFFGNLTLGAVQKFQCDNNIVCSGAPGWGVVGPKTRAALNALSPSSSPASSLSAINAEIQALQQELKNLEVQPQ
jgi:fibronectin type 3 domain-containing protein